MYAQGTTWQDMVRQDKLRSCVYSDDEVTCLVQNPEIPQAGLVWAHGRTAGWGRAGRYANRIVHLLDNLFFSPPKHRKNVAKSACDQILSNPKPVHTSGRSGRRAWQSGRERSDKIGRQQNDSPRNRRCTVLSKALKNIQFNVFPESSDIDCKPTEEQNQRLTHG